MIIQNLEDKISACFTDETAQYTDFLTMEEISRAEALLCQTGLFYQFWGGYEQAERKMAVLSVEPISPKYPYVILCGKWDRFYEISHRDVLGAVMASGIERKCIGDILFDTPNRKFYLFVLSHMADYIASNISQMGRGSIVWSITDDVTDLPQSAGEEIKISVSSLRIDAVIATAFHLSRQKAQDVIAEKKVYINHALVSKATQNIDIGDSVVLRGCGKIVFMEKCGFSKKGKLYILIKQYL